MTTMRTGRRRRTITNRLAQHTGRNFDPAYRFYTVDRRRGEAHIILMTKRSAATVDRLMQDNNEEAR